MPQTRSRCASRLCGLALLVLAPLVLPSSPAAGGNLNACDEARVAVREAISAAYRPVLADLDKRLAQTAVQAQTVPPTSPPGGAVAPDLAATRSDLERQQASDFGSAVKRIEGDCRGSLAPVAEITKSATDLADRGIASVLAAHGMTADLGVSPRSP